jgi:hypothetical protein
MSKASARDFDFGSKNGFSAKEDTLVPYNSQY